MKIYFHRGHGVGAALIRFFSRSKYAHVSIGFLNGDLYEAVPFKGCRKTRLKTVKGVTPFTFKHGAYVDAGLVRAYLDAEVGTRYDYIGVLAFVLGFFRPSKNRMFCSEYVFNAIRAGGVELQERTRGSILRPDQLAMSPVITVDSALDFQWKNPLKWESERTNDF